jgi:hypothetical protein
MLLGARVLSNSFQRRASSKSGVAAVGDGIRCPVIGAGGEEAGFRPIARRGILIMAGGFPLMAGETPMVGEAVTVLTTIGERSHIPIGAGEDPPVAGVIHSQSQTGLTLSYPGRGLFFDLGSRAPQNIPEIIQWDALAVSGVLRVGSRVTIICFARVVLC